MSTPGDCPRMEGCPWGHSPHTHYGDLTVMVGPFAPLGVPPLSRAEKIVVSQLKASTHRAHQLIAGQVHVLGAVPDNAQIAAARSAALASLESLLLALKQRKFASSTPGGEG